MMLVRLASDSNLVYSFCYSIKFWELITFLLTLIHTASLLTIRCSNTFTPFDHFYSSCKITAMKYYCEHLEIHVEEF